MDNSFMAFDQIKKLYPDEWVLLGYPEMNATSVMGGVVLCHSKGKKEVCYKGKDKTAGFDRVTIAFAGENKRARRLGILRRF